MSEAGKRRKTTRTEIAKTKASEGDLKSDPNIDSSQPKIDTIFKPESKENVQEEGVPESEKTKVKVDHGESMDHSGAKNLQSVDDCDIDKASDSPDPQEEHNCVKEDTCDIDTDSHEAEEEHSEATQSYEMGGFFSKKEERPSLLKKWSGRDTREYREEYPGKRDDPKITMNLEFYSNEIESTPSGGYIDDIHKDWWGNYKLLESHHGYIQWLFPIREEGMNFQAQPLQLHEAKAIKSDPKAKERVLKSYEMMLDFYGIKLKDPATGEVGRAENWEPRFTHLNKSYHNYLRITRILKCLGELGYEHLKPPLVEFFLQEALTEGTLPNITNSCMDYFVHTLRNERERQRLIEWGDQNWKPVKTSGW